MGPTHTRIEWIDVRDEALPAMQPALSAYLAPFGFQVQLHGDSPDLVLFIADSAKQAYNHAAFSSGRHVGKSMVVLLTQANAMDRVALLDLGADDCMVMPIEQRELAARLHALRRRQKGRSNAQQQWVRFGPWMLDTDRRQINSVHGDEAILSPSEYRLLLTFLSLPLQVISRDRLMDEARGRGLEAFDRSIDLLVSRLRQKLGDDPRHPRLIQTVRGQGYLFNAAPHAPLSAQIHNQVQAIGFAH